MSDIDPLITLFWVCVIGFLVLIIPVLYMDSRGWLE